MWTQYQLWTAMRPTVVGYCLCEPCTQTESTLLWQDEVSQGFEHIISLALFPTALGNNSVTIHLNLAYIIHPWTGVMFTKCQHLSDTDRTETSVKNIKASLTSTLKPEREREREVCKHTNKSLFQNKREKLKTSISHYLKHTTHYQK